MGIASQLMNQAHLVLKEIGNMKAVTLHVRYTNIAAKNLYLRTLGYEEIDVERGYYADGEDGFYLRKNL